MVAEETVHLYQSVLKPPLRFQVEVLHVTASDLELYLRAWVGSGEIYQ